MKYTKDKVVEDLINYAMGSPYPILDELMDSLDLWDIDSNRVRCELVQFKHEWESVPCNPDGPTKEQNAKLDAILDKYADRIIKIGDEL